MENIFVNNSLQKEMNKKGYVIIKNLLGQNEISELNTFCDNYRLELKEPFHSSHFSYNVDYKKEAHKKIVDIVFPILEAYLNNFIAFFGNFMIKNPSPDGGLPLHADWTYIDEKKANSIAAWIPMIDVDESNGCMGIIESSHKITNIIRGPNILQSSQKNDDAWIEEYGKLIPLKAGDALIYNHRLMHYSFPNQSDTVRPALNLSMIPKNQKCFHYCIPAGVSDIEKYEILSSDFFFEYHFMQRPKEGVLLKTLHKDVIKSLDKKMLYFPIIKMLSEILSVLSF